ncbi:uncharacterized protein LOC135492406 [Lineus longissimus]|uniref:uncharacterized protein LOC135492406 n=1 Tax=Lineus longissimus TaxID=88925 RepID=UPI002B4F37B4
MPASEFSWTTSQQLPPFQVYASKRKCDQDCFMEQDDGQSTQKRPCLIPQSQGTQSVPEHHMTPFQHEQNQMQAVRFDQVDSRKQSQPHVVPSQSWPDVHLPMSEICEPAEMNNNCLDVMPNANTTNLIMNINDETYSTQPHHQEPNEQQVCASMEDDFVPDQRQYDRDGEFCKEYCGYGNVSPNSGKVRCYCKPSWEAMLEVRPYISDYY